MDIQWYPGHMTKAKRRIEQDIKLVDLIIELRDARAPEASRNPDIGKLTGSKKRMILLNKADLADPAVTEKWVSSFEKEQLTAIPLDGRTRNAASRIKKAVSDLSREKRERDAKRGITGERPVKALVCGIPNVGKSTFINSMFGKASTKTGNAPGVTKGNQWVNVSNELLLLDTPGILWPKFDDRETALCLAMMGSISDNVLNKEELAVKLLSYLSAEYSHILPERYNITEEELSKALERIDDSILGIDVNALAYLDVISAKRGCLKKGGVPDYAKCSALIIDDFRSGRLGRITLQKPGA